MNTNHTIDAKGKKIGRVASEAAKLLMGKNLTTFARHKAPDITVTITNAGKVSVTEKKGLQTKFARFSGYQGGLKFETLSALKSRQGGKAVLFRAVRGMLPNNKLRPKMLKRLKISD
jgi:large subunit ribosomal protein L13